MADPAVILVVVVARSGRTKTAAMRTQPRLSVRAPRPPAATLLAVVVSCIGARATRHVPGGGHWFRSGLDNDDLRVDDAGDVVLPNGTAVRPFGGLEPESTLADDAFVCYQGQVFGIRVPGKAAQGEKFYYVGPSPVQTLWPLQAYLDTAEPRRQFLLYPPIDGLTDHWRLLYRVSSSLEKSAVTLEQRFFAVGPEHPCGDQGDWEMRVAEATLEKALMGYKAAKKKPEVEDGVAAANQAARAAAAGPDGAPSLARLRPDEPRAYAPIEVGRAAVEEHEGERKPGVLARLSAALRGLMLGGLGRWTGEASPTA